MSFTVLDGFNELARGAKRLPCRDGLRVKTGSTGIAEGRRTAKDMGVVCAVRGMSACAPLIPLRRTPLTPSRVWTACGVATQYGRSFFSHFFLSGKK